MLARDFDTMMQNHKAERQRWEQQHANAQLRSKIGHVASLIQQVAEQEQNIRDVKDRAEKARATQRSAIEKLQAKEKEATSDEARANIQASIQLRLKHLEAFDVGSGTADSISKVIDNIFKINEGGLIPAGLERSSAALTEYKQSLQEQLSSLPSPIVQSFPTSPLLTFHPQAPQAQALPPKPQSQAQPKNTPLMPAFTKKQY